MSLLVGVCYEVRDERVGDGFALVCIVHSHTFYYVTLQSATCYHLPIVVNHGYVVVHIVEAQAVAFEESVYALVLTWCGGVKGLYLHRC